MIFWALLGCGSGLSHPSTIESLQTVGIAMSPPTIAPGETATVTLAIADPLGTGADVVLASCLRFEGRCAEEALTNPSDWLNRATLLPGESTLSILQPISPNTREVFDFLGVDEISLALVAVACEPGLCPIISRIDDALLAGEVSDRLAVDIAQPERWLPSLPIEGVSLTSRLIQLKASSSNEDNQNPFIEARFKGHEADVIEIPRGVEQELAFYVSDDSAKTYVYVYTTLGAFSSRGERVLDNATRQYLMSEEVGDGHVFIIFEDSEGGSAIWERRIRVY